MSNNDDFDFSRTIPVFDRRQTGVEEVESEKIFLRRESDIMDAVVNSVKAVEPFYARPSKIGNDIMLGWSWAIQKKEISPRVAEEKLREDVGEVLRELRTELWRLQALEIPRLAVLIHLSLVLGVAQVKGMTNLWHALDVKDYENAHDILLMTNWPSIMSTGSEEGKYRVIAMCRTMRTGQSPKSRKVS